MKWLALLWRWVMSLLAGKASPSTPAPVLPFPIKVEVTMPTPPEPLPLPPPAPAPAPADIRKPIDYPRLSGVSLPEIQGKIDSALGTLKPSEHGAVVAYVDTDGQARLSVFGRQGEHWTYVATANHSPSAGWGGDAEVRYSW